MLLEQHYLLRRKLYFGFSLVILTNILIGLVGWYGARQLEENIATTGRIIVPADEYVHDLSVTQFKIKVAIAFFLVALFLTNACTFPESLHISFLINSFVYFLLL